METVVMSFCGLCLLLVLGKLVRTAVPLFQRLYLPASVIGGLLGLLWINTLGKSALPGWHDSWGALPGFLINIVFAALFIGAKIPKMRTIWSEASPQLCMGQLLAWGQYVIGLGLTAVVLIPLFGVNKAFGNLLEIGFEGGHGTVAGLTKTFMEFDWEAGIALGYTMATVG
ncbi:MAG: sodium:glutamate symporter, partial [Lentisphaeria bacterium]|nr:sodium:glutamate symporter [Lentisphaeria bacterium]